ncbi:trypsin-like peptidase domain-containing protein [Streptomyces yaizuensis]|uniref:Trypsin-like peptidase domain-containing protein n=1 Tax=Streptomyces yaizuensis TaxID=2989713 RepID=A0ABQ5NVU6_9ACTN|nr:trypsin-like peptidase domain-containing protein [Streptomyces sp. YSPA8]GLF94485.1 trypsin-like peptidase domain-containing protein [Streptomyces sp. YSPA8]
MVVSDAVPVSGGEAEVAAGPPTVSLTKTVPAASAHDGSAALLPVPAPAGPADRGAPVPGAAPVSATVPEPAAVAAHTTGGAGGPLHEPDAYSTPPYGEPGPWAPAPPVQRPAPGAMAGTSVPPPFPGGRQPYPDSTAATTDTAAVGAPATAGAVGVAGGYAHTPLQAPGFAAGPPPQQPGGPGQAPGGQWLQYDPWAAPGGPVHTAPFSQAGEPPRRRNRYGPLLAGAVLLALVAGGVGGGIGAYVERNGGINRVELDQAPRESRDRAPDSVAGIAAKALPGVVTLHVSGGGEQGTGTGFVLDGQGHILTNNHVVDPAGESGAIRVTFSGGETVRATLVGKDSGYDLAVVKVTGVSGLTPLPLGNSENVRVGDPVVAIGAPFDLQNTVTSGIISAKDRPITAGGDKGDGSDVSYVDALQTDAPINPGNSGGPLVDTTARVIGINSAIRAADTGPGAEGRSGSIGLGFAIPINQGKRVAEELINTGKATHPVIGVSLDMKFTGDGARVGDKGKDDTPSVVPGGPSARAGVRPGDVITAVNGRRVHSGEELIVKIRAHRPGDRLELTLERGGKERTVTVTLGSSGDD